MGAIDSSFSGLFLLSLRFYHPFSIPNPLRGCNPDAVKLLQHSTTPSPRVAGFEDEDDAEYENEAPRTI